ncbi:MAG TPA: hypothetical protein VFE47_23410 [Tepidisphaeraceae bacterium]|jgi:hypothetical protein|nr:hypothetical protein [Tepidisphaeraceae bacterium]
MRRLLASSVLAVGLTFGGVTASAPANATRTQLNQTLPEVQFSGVAFNDAIDFLRDVSGANIAVNWKALEEAGVTKDTPINVRLRAVSMKKALEMVLIEAGGGDKLGYDVDGNVISITTKELVDSKMYTRVYSILDLITEIPDFTDAPDFSLNSTSNNQQQNPQGGGGIGANNGGGGGGGGNGGGGLFGNSTPTKEPVKSKEDRAKDLIDLIVAVIQPDVWQDNGGKASIRYFNGSIIVTAPRSVQEAIGGVWD